MKLAIIGSRNIPETITVLTINEIIKDMGVTHIVSGGARGADSLGEYYAKYYGLEAIIFKPDWSIGRHAGMLRNTKIIEEAEVILAIWDGASKGTHDSIKKAIKAGKPVMILDSKTMIFHRSYAQYSQYQKS